MKKNILEERKRFFETLFEGTKGYIEIRTILEGRIKQSWYKTSEINRLLIELGSRYFQRVNTYFGVCPRTIEKGKEENVKQVNCLWADLDCAWEQKPNEPAREERIKTLESFQPKPSIVIDSGHGFQVYWLFDKPEDIDSPEDILRLKGYNRGLAEELKGDKGIDLCRVLRVPGTKNLKDPKNILAVTITKFEPQIRYSLKGQFLARFKRATSNKIERVEIDRDSAGNIPDRFWKILDENTKIKATWKGRRKDLKDETRSGYDMALSNLLMPFGFTDSELVSILRENESGKGREAKAQYLAMTIGKAKAAWEKQKREAEKRLKDDKERFLSLGEGKKKAPSSITAKEEQPKYDLAKTILPAGEFLKIETPEKKTILSPWLKEKQIILISGWRGVGKTWLALSLLDSITRKKSFGSWKAETPVNCLYLDAEMAKQDLDERLLMLNPDQERQSQLSIYSSELANILGDPRPCLFDLTWQALFKDFLIVNQINLWVADNITSLTPGLDENAKSEWDSVNQWLLELRFSGITTILIHHLGKGGTQRGTSAREDNIDISIQLNYPPGYVDTDGCKFELKFTKTRLRHSELKDISDLQLQLIEDEKGRSTWTYASIRKETAREVLIRLDRGDSQAIIAADLNITPARVSQIKMGAQRDKKLDSGKKLTDKGKQAIGKDDLTLLNYEK
ncbi:MAG: AAA family ATPase [Clostridia bacterium]|jgi:hypothetical protein|nr:AAA family ATPase [Clostridia bacterium]